MLTVTNMAMVRIFWGCIRDI